MKRIAIINGPELDRLGTREPEIYGTRTLQDLEADLRQIARDLGVELEFFQSNEETVLVAYILGLKVDGIVINPAAYTHTSAAICVAIKNSGIPAIEVHISNIHAREEWRRKSITAEACCGMIAGLGFAGYGLAIEYLVRYFQDSK